MGRGDVVGVSFNVVAPLERGETICLVGDVAALGSGDHRYGVQLVTDPDVFPEWYTAQPIPLPPDQTISYRYCILSGGELSRWEELPDGESRKLFVESPTTINDILQIPGTDNRTDGGDEDDDQSSASRFRSTQHKLPTRQQSSDNQERMSHREKRRKGLDLESTDGVMVVSHFLPVKIQRSNIRPPSSPEGDTPSTSRVDSSRSEFIGSFSRPSPSPNLSTSVSSMSSSRSSDSNLDTKYTRERSDSESGAQDWIIEWNESTLLSRKKKSAADYMRVVYIGVPNIEPPVQPHERSGLRAALSRFRCVPVFLDEEIARLHYLFCYDTLRKLFHHQVDVYGPLPTRWWNAKLHEASWQAYREVNQAFLGICVEEYQDTDLIWVHGYELLLLPSMLARRLKRRKPPIGLFIHSPFPSSEIFRTLSVRDELLIGMLNADQIGFHLYEYARPFLSCCHRILGIPHDGNENDRHGVLTVDYQGRRVLITVCHGGIEAAMVRNKLRSDAVSAKAYAMLRACIVPYPAPSGSQTMFVEEKVPVDGKPPLLPPSSAQDPQRQQLSAQGSAAFSGASSTTNHGSHTDWLNADQVIIAGLDDIEFLRGIHFKLVSYEKLLELERSKKSPWLDRLCLLQVLVHTRQESEESREVLHIVRELARRINRSFPRPPGKRPAVVLVEWSSSSFEDRLALFSIADILMITPLRSGLGLSAFEYTVVTDERATLKSGPWTALANSPEVSEEVRQIRTHSSLVLSEFTAAFRVLPGSLRCNPWRDNEVVESIQSALSMDPEERQARHAAALRYVINHDETGWALRVLTDIKTARPMSSEGKHEGLTPDGLGLGLQFRAVEFRPNFQHLTDDIMMDAYRAAESRLIVLDYGGTTVSDDAIPQEGVDESTLRHKFEFRYRPKGEAIVPASGMIRSLKMLLEDPRNNVFIVSGRERQEVEAAFADIPNIGLTAEHGCFYSLPDRMRSSASVPASEDSGEIYPKQRSTVTPPLVSGTSGSDLLHAPPRHQMGRRRARSSSSDSQETRPSHRSRTGADFRRVQDMLMREWITLSDVFDSSWMDLSEQIMDVYTQRTDGTYIERKGSSIVWQFRDAEPEFAALQASELQDHLHGVLKAFPIEVVSGKGYVEVCPQGIDKGNAVAHILDMVYGATDDLPDFVLCIGDDIADEAMFEFFHELHANGREDLLGKFTRNDSVFGSSIQMLAHSILGRERGSSFNQDDAQQDSDKKQGGEDAATSSIGTDSPPPPHPLLRHHSRTPIEPWKGDLFTCVVGEKPSVAQYFVNDVEEVQSVLEFLARVSSKSRGSRSMGDMLGPSSPHLQDRSRRTYESYTALPSHSFQSHGPVTTIREDKVEDMDDMEPHEERGESFDGATSEDEADSHMGHAAAIAASAAKHHQSYLDLRRPEMTAMPPQASLPPKRGMASASMPALSEYFSLDVSQPTSTSALDYLDLVANDDEDDAGITF